MTDMEISVQAGRYVVAVSGGVDSMVLLDLLRQKPDLELTVAHFDHGIRPDSQKDRELVQELATRYGLPFVCAQGKLGPGTSEAAAREARYEFLERVQAEQGAAAIITGHHQDDLLETAILNLLRGTGRKGLAALRSRPSVLRPMLHLTKEQIFAYAHAHQLQWHEDSTNSDNRYLRNYVRRQLLPRFTPADRQRLLRLIDDTHATNRELDATLDELFAQQPRAGEFGKKLLIRLPHRVACEVLASWLRANGVASFDAPTIERLVIAAKTQRSGAILDIVHGASLLVGAETLALRTRER